MIRAEFPAKLKCLFNKLVRYIILWGGRGGTKSWGVARALLIRGAEQPLRILCAREIQKSIADSSYQLLKDQIHALELDDFYEVLNTEIRGKNGTLFIFAGLKHNVSNIKSKEGIDIVWVDEAEKVTKNSWDTLIPTIRKEGSQIIVTFNIDIEEGETYQRFVIHPPTNSIIEKLTYRDNPWFPAVLEQERLDCLARDPVGYDNIWEGNPKAAVEGAIFAKELQRAGQEGRITSVPYDPTVPVCTYWDLGKSALTAIWFIQYVGMQWRVLRHYSNHLEDLGHYLKLVQSLPYVYEKHYLPHDGTQKRLGMILNIKEQAAKVLKNVETVPRIAHKADAIDAAKRVFPLCHFDKELCADGLSDLRHYAYRITEDGKISSEPEEGTFYRDTADAFMTFAQTCRPPKIRDPLDELYQSPRRRRSQSTAWWT